MFGNKEKPNQQEVPMPVSSKSASSKDIKTLIGEGCKVEGNFFIPTATRIDGTIKGDLTGDSGVVIGHSGRIIGSVCAVEVVVFGIIEGNVETHRLELKKGCKMNGDVIVGTIITEDGSVFNGKCSMKDESTNVTELVPEFNDTTGNVKIKSVMS